MSKGRLYIISAPSGAGKSTLCSMLINKYPAVRYSISYTTRAPRGNEINGKEYFFMIIIMAHLNSKLIMH